MIVRCFIYLLLLLNLSETLMLHSHTRYEQEFELHILAVAISRYQGLQVKEYDWFTESLSID